MNKPLHPPDRELLALLALKRISGGEITFLNVLDADILVRKGLADRYGKGQFVLTDAGYALLKNLGL